MKGPFLVDTSAISEIAPERQGGSAAAKAWFSEHQREMYLSALTIMEIAQGVVKLRRKAPGRRAEAYAKWLVDLEEAFARKILPFDQAIAHRAAALSDLSFALGRHPGFVDIAIAATAQAHGYTLLTRNLKHFDQLPLTLFDPFAPI